jgi:hypothetical protein
MARQPYPSDVTDEEWEFAAPYLTLMTRDAPQREHDLREVFNGMRWVVRAGSPWRYLPHDLPPWAGWRRQSWQLYRILHPWFPGHSFDRTTGGNEGKVPASVRAAMRVDGSRGRTHAVYYKGERVTVVPAGLNAFGLYVLGVLSFGGSAWGLWQVLRSPVSPSSVTPFILGPALLVGVGVLLRRRLVIDNRAGTTLPKFVVTEGDFPTRHILARDLAAVQLCEVRLEGEHGMVMHVPFRLPSFTPVQVNLICLRPAGGRVHILSDTDPTRVEQTALRLAEFVGVPMLDHRGAVQGCAACDDDA